MKSDLEERPRKRDLEDPARGGIRRRAPRFVKVFGSGSPPVGPDQKE